jgi:hypothetical protein
VTRGVGGVGARRGGEMTDKEFIEWLVARLYDEVTGGDMDTDDYKTLSDECAKRDIDEPFGDDAALLEG